MVAVLSIKKQKIRLKYLLIVPHLFIKLLLRILTVVTFLVLAVYLNSEVYDFPNTVPFEGPNIYNPYQNISQNTIKANFHAHSKAWGGITNGHNTASELKDSYEKKGYDIAAISNYFSQDKANEEFKVYEHGLNISKAHCLAVNANKVEYFDYPIFQNTSHKQNIINRLKNNGALVVLAHPGVRGGHSTTDMRALVGYKFTEVLNHYCTSDKEWDAALQTGKLSWIMANDDTHDINNEPSHMIWNEIYIESNDKKEIIKNIIEGKNYGIRTKNGFNDLYIKYLYTKKDSIYFDFGKQANKIICIQNGTVCKTIERSNGKLYMPTNSNYIRFEVESQNSKLYTNPLVRFGNKKPVTADFLYPTVNLKLTLLERTKYFFLLIVFICGVNRRLIINTLTKNAKTTNRKPAYS